MQKIYALLFTLLIVCFVTQSVKAQRRYCYTDELWAQQVHADSSLLIKRRQMDAIISRLSNTAEGLHTGNAKSLGATPPVVVPTVIYIVYDSASVNISMVQIQSQMDQLNQNFAAYGFGFCLAKINVVTGAAFVPQAGDSAGVFRIYNPALTNVVQGNDASLKALSTLPSANYMRIFVVHTISPTGVLGYTQFPGGPAATDGIVMRYDAFGSNNFCNVCQLFHNYNLGASVTHEVGHFFDLYHTFQGGCDTGSAGGVANCQLFGDQVCDTPPCDGTFGCPNPAPFSCDGITRELTQNYMDYTDDPCKNSFTTGQVARMNFATSAYHSVLVSTANLVSTGVSCAQLGNQYASFYCANYNGCVNMPVTFQSVGAAGFTYTWNFGDGTTATGDTVQHSFAAAGQFQVTLTAVNTVQGLSAVNTLPVFITVCHPIQCSLNKWEFEYGYMDFSSGTPVAENHKSIRQHAVFADFYAVFYRGDGAGNPLFHVGFQGVSDNSSVAPIPLLDTSFNQIDSFAVMGETGPGHSALLPVPQKPGYFCYAQNSDKAVTGGSRPDTLVYSIIYTHNGTASVVPGKKFLKFPAPAINSSPWWFQMVGIPNCDGTKMWLVVHVYAYTNTGSNQFMVFALDSSGTFTLNQTYIAANDYQFGSLVASPDGRKIAIAVYNSAVSPAAAGLSYLNFDKSLGKITNYVSVYLAQPAVTSQYYGNGVPCFSPNSRFLYYQGNCCDDTVNSTDYFYQYDLYNSNPYLTRKAISQSVYPANAALALGVQHCHLGPDNKVYIGHFTSPDNTPAAFRMAVINYPDILENGSNSTGFNALGPEMKPANCPYFDISFTGYQSIVDQVDAYGCNWQPNVPNFFSYVANSCLNYQFYSDECWNPVWNFGDISSGTANTSTLGAPVHTFSAPGTYAVKLQMNGYSFTDTVVIAAPSPLIAATPINPCPVPLANYSIANIQPWVNYSWTVTNGTPAYTQGQNNINVNWNTADTNGRIVVVAINTSTGCTDTSTLNVSYVIHDSTAYNNVTASICNGGAYTFNNQHLTTPGVYADTIITSAGCKNITLLTLQVEKPDVTWPGGSDTVTANGGITLSGATPAGGTYTGTGVTNNIFYPGQGGNGPDTITYTYADSNGCSALVSHIFVVLGVTDVSIENQIDLYPNPANNTVIVRSHLFTGSSVKISLYDVMGQLITVPVTNVADKAVFDISEITNGVYWFRFIINGHEAGKRFVKM